MLRYVMYVSTELEKNRLKEKSKRKKMGYFITIQEVIHKEDITVINIYAANNRAST